ncbi:MAG: NAD(P)H-dependent oxidoreductase [Candidatus Dactylopiibacterium sp.]|nr:NAD(P)H-dependent oxidoreductase [Candidatus Dactylopiibacterium sp.]
MTQNRSVAVIVGSLRKASLNRRVAQVLVDLAPPSLDARFVEIGELPLFNQDLDDAGSPPEAWTHFRARVKGFDALLFVTPEYNRSMPGVLKNALDVGSRPYGQSVWGGKPGAVITASPGATGGFGSNHHLRQTLVSLDVPTMTQPEVYLGKADAFFDDGGQLTDERTRTYLAGFMTAFAAWVGKQLG